MHTKKKKKNKVKLLSENLYDKHVQLKNRMVQLKNHFIPFIAREAGGRAGILVT